MVVDTSQVMDLRSPKSAGQVTYQQPGSYLVDDLRPSAAGHGLVGLRFVFTLSSPNGWSRFVAAFLRVRFDDVRVAATDIWFENMPASQTSVSVPRPGMVGWLIGDPMATLTIPDHTVAHVIARVPVGSTVLSGTMYVDVSSTTPLFGRLRRRHACSARGSRFVITPPPGWSSVARPVADSPRPVTAATDELQPAVRLCYAADIERFSRFTAPESIRAQRRFVELMSAARTHAGLDGAKVIVQESGDGQFVVLPPGLDESVVLPKLVEGLRLAVRETNADLNQHARLRLRVAFHRGHVLPGANGWAGDATIAVHRLLDSDVLRRALAGTPDADLAFIVPEVLYREIVVHEYGTLDPGEFVKVEAVVSAKRFSEPAWVHV